MTTFKKSGGRCAVSAVVSASSFRLQGRGGSPSGPKFQAQRAVKPKSTTRSSRETRVERRAPFPLSCPVECEALFHWGPPQRLCRLRHQPPVLGRRPFQLFRFSVFQLFPHRPSSAIGGNAAPATRYPPPCPVESCFFIPLGRATAAQPPPSSAISPPPSAKGLWQLLRHPPTEAAWK